MLLHGGGDLRGTLGHSVAGGLRRLDSCLADGVRDVLHLGCCGVIGGPDDCDRLLHDLSDCPYGVAVFPSGCPVHTPALVHDLGHDGDDGPLNGHHDLGGDLGHVVVRLGGLLLGPVGCRAHVGRSGVPGGRRGGGDCGRRVGNTAHDVPHRAVPGGVIAGEGVVVDVGERIGGDGGGCRVERDAVLVEELAVRGVVPARTHVDLVGRRVGPAGLETELAYQGGGRGDGTQRVVAARAGECGGAGRELADDVVVLVGQGEAAGGHGTAGSVRPDQARARVPGVGVGAVGGDLVGAAGVLEGTSAAHLVDRGDDTAGGVEIVGLLAGQNLLPVGVGGVDGGGAAGPVLGHGAAGGVAVGVLAVGGQLVPLVVGEDVGADLDAVTGRVVGVGGGGGAVVPGGEAVGEVIGVGVGRRPDDAGGGLGDEVAVPVVAVRHRRQR